MSRDSSILRRDFLAGVSTVCAIGFAGAASGLGATASRQPESLLEMTHTDFAGLIGHRFQVDGSNYLKDQQRACLVLQEVVRHEYPNDRDRPPHLRPEAFSLLFAAPLDCDLKDGTHRVVGAGLPPADLFLHHSPDVRDPAHRHYELIFN